MTDNIYIFTYLIAFIPIIAVFSFMPYITRRNVFFGVSAPSDFYNSDTAKSMRRSYSTRVIMVGAIMIMASFMSSYFMDDKFRPIAMLVSILVLIGIVTLFYINMWNRAKKLKTELEWYKQIKPVAIADTSFYTSKIAVSKYWFAVYILIILATIVVGLVFYDKMPQKVPMQTDINGLTTYMQKSYQLLFYMPAVQLFLTATFMFVYYSVKKARPELNSQDIKNTVEQNIKFRYAWSCFLMFGGIALLSVFFLTQLEMLSVLQGGITMTATFAVVGLMLLSAILLAVKMGQSGSRINSKEKTDTKVIDKQDDSVWKLGMFYFNKEDPALFVEKRFGVGFTINFAKPAAWIVLAIIVIIVIGAIILNR